MELYDRGWTDDVSRQIVVPSPSWSGSEEVATLFVFPARLTVSRSTLDPGLPSEASRRDLQLTLEVLVKLLATRSSR